MKHDFRHNKSAGFSQQSLLRNVRQGIRVWSCMYSGFSVPGVGFNMVSGSSFSLCVGRIRRRLGHFQPHCTHNSSSVLLSPSW